MTYDTIKLLETDKEESSRLEKERQENEESAKNVRRIYGIDNTTTTNENPLELKGHSHCLEKQQKLREELDAVKGQMIHYKKFFDENVISNECKKVSTVYGKNITAEQEMDKSLNSEIEKDGGRMIIEQLKDENTELKDRVGHLEQKMAETKIRIVTATPSYCKKIYDISQRKENATVCLIIDGSDLFGVIDHYPTTEELENMIPSS